METKKAYKLVVDNLLLDEPWHYEAPIVYAETAGEAKSKGIKYFYDYRVEDSCDYGRYGDREIVFTDIKARRVKRLDKVIYKDQWVTQEQLNQYLWMEERDRKAETIWKENPNGVAVVWAGCYNSYWGENRAGYWSKIEDAGKYSTKEAFDIVRGNSYDRQEIVELLDKEQYNSDLQKKISNLQNSLL